MSGIGTQTARLEAVPDIQPVILSYPQSARDFNESRAVFKLLISGESFEARAIYGTPETMRSTFKCLFLANGLPRFKNGTDAELRRLRFVPFLQKPGARDTTLKDRLKAEASGIFNWLLDGLTDLLCGREIPLGGAEARVMYERFNKSNDPIGAFIQSDCVLAANAKVAKQDLLSAYATFLEDAGLPPDLANSFFKRFQERYPQIGSGKHTLEGVRRAAFTGIGLRVSDSW